MALDLIPDVAGGHTLSQTFVVDGWILLLQQVLVDGERTLAFDPACK